MAEPQTRPPRRALTALWLNSAYFWYFASIGCFGPYIALHYRQLGLTGPQIGVLAAILPLGVAVLAPLWGSLADTFSAHRLVLRCALLVGATAALLIASATGFVALLLLLIVLAACLAVIPSILDGYAVMFAERTGGSYGQIRVWGTVGFISGVWFVARLMGQVVSPVFLVAYAATLLLALLVSLGLPRLQARSPQRLWHGIAAIVRERPVQVLLINVYLVIANVTIMASYYGLYLTELGADVVTVGTASIVAAVSEVPVMLLGARVLRRLGSRRVLLAAVVAYVLRLLLYSLPPALSWVVAVQLLHGVSFGLYLLASVTLMHELAGAERVATGQGLLNATAQGLAAVTGALLGGLLLDRIGALGLFRLATLGMGVALLVCIVSVRLVATPEPGVKRAARGGTAP